MDTWFTQMESYVKYRYPLSAVGRDNYMLSPIESPVGRNLCRKLRLTEEGTLKICTGFNHSCLLLEFTWVVGRCFE